MIHEYSIENGDKPFLFLCDVSKNSFAFVHLKEGDVLATRLSSCIQFDSAREIYKHLLKNYNVNILSDVLNQLEEFDDVERNLIFSKERQIKNSVDVNSAAVQELADLNGVGQARAEAIIVGRPWNNVLDLTQVNGISAKMLAQLNIRV